MEYHESRDLSDAAGPLAVHSDEPFSFAVSSKCRDRLE
jgi:hypothetical protein